MTSIGIWCFVDDPRLDKGVMTLAALAADAAMYK
jgi:hypothetical protein